MFLKLMPNHMCFHTPDILAQAFSRYKNLYCLNLHCHCTELIRAWNWSGFAKTGQCKITLSSYSFLGMPQSYSAAHAG